MPAPSRDVLIVDDDDSLRHLISTNFEQAGLTFDTAADGVYAVEHLIARRYTVVLLDLTMPRLDGIGVLQEIRELALPDSERPIVVIVTGEPDRDSLVTAGDLAQVIIRKPVDVGTLSHLVRDCVQARRAERISAPD